MGCNCGDKKAAPETYVHTDAAGKVVAYKSQTEAEAARIRRGGSVRKV